MNEVEELKSFYLSHFGDEESVRKSDRVFYKLLKHKEYKFIFSVWSTNWDFISKRVFLIRSFITGKTRNGEEYSPAPNFLSDKLVTEIIVRLSRVAFALKVNRPLNRHYWDSQDNVAKESIRAMHCLIDLTEKLENSFLEYFLVKMMLNHYGCLPPSVYSRVPETVNFFREIKGE